jgi:hypothetical protein
MKSFGYGYATNETENGYQYHSHVDAEELLELYRVSSQARVQKANRIVGIVEER